MERKQLKMHNKLLLDVIKRQAGTLHKALLEGIMNGIEAGASRIDISFDVDEHDKAHLAITDDGKGITSLKEIEDFFETFGTPHDESEGKIWAQFRMGRGQLFSFGKNTWRTGEFKMEVDIEEMGLDYNLGQNQDEYDGCRIDIDLYKSPIGKWNQYPSVESFSDSVQEQVEFMSTPIYFNGKKLNKDANKLKWTLEDDNAYYLFGVGTDLAIYNLGAFVTKVPEHRAGVTGVVVSKEQLKVNFARNDVQHDCEVYQAINVVVAANRKKKTRQRRNNLSPAERNAILLDVRDGAIDFADVKATCLVYNAVGRAVKLPDILKNNLPWSFAERGDQKADRLMQRDEAFIIDKAIIDDLRYQGPPQQFFTWLVKNALLAEYSGEKKLKKWERLENTYKPFDQITEAFSNSHTMLPHNKLTMKEKYILRTLEGYDCWEGRSLSIGLSDTADAWTDGRSYIVMDRNWIKRLMLPYADGVAKMVNILVHELAHDEDSSGTHVHGPEFYERFHDLCCRSYNPQQFIICDFRQKLNSSKLMMREEKEDAKKEREAKKVENALGIAASER